MAVFVKTGEHYFKSFYVFKKKCDQFVPHIGNIRNHLASVIKKLPQH